MTVLRPLSTEVFQHIVAICTTKWLLEGGDVKELPTKLAASIEHEVFVRTYVGSKPKEEPSVKGPRLSKVRAVVLKTNVDKPRKAKRGRKRMTPAERKAVGKRMRKYWAARRKAKE